MNTLEWIGYFMSGWTGWAVFIIITAIILIGVIYALSTPVGDHPWKNREWWQDKQKRLEKEAAIRESKRTATEKKG